MSDRSLASLFNAPPRPANSWQGRRRRIGAPPWLAPLFAPMFAMCCAGLLLLTACSTSTAQEGAKANAHTQATAPPQTEATADTAASTASAAKASPAVTRIAIGSCFHQTQGDQKTIWEAIHRYQPQLFLFIGDNIYGDTTDPKKLAAKYEDLGNNPGYRKLGDMARILPTWDDHDYGINDAGKEHPRKVESQRVFCDFYGFAKDDPRRERPGVYGSETHGPVGKRVQVILLDTRYFRDAMKKRPGGRTKRLGPYIADENAGATVLGAAQWAWLEKQLKQPAELRIIASSIQVASDEHGWECWGNFNTERKRLFQLIKKTGAKGVVFVSGDRHSADISSMPTDFTGVSYPLLDLTASSMNRPGSWEGEPNRFRVTQQTNYRQVNFGTITVTWTPSGPKATAAVHNGRGEVVRKHDIGLKTLAQSP